MHVLLNKTLLMTTKMHIIRALILLPLVTYSNAAPVTPGELLLEHHMTLVPDEYDLYWRVVEADIIIEIHVKTLGYVAFGISRSGGMANSDIVTAWVKNNVTYFQDRHATGNKQPEIDEEQNWELIFGRQEDGYTKIKFRRGLVSCDKPNDVDITDDTMRIIFAYHPDEPHNSGDISYHGNRRGVRSVRLVTHGVQKNVDKLPEFTGYFDILNPNVLIPTKETTYWCQALKIPEFTEEVSIVRIEPMVRPEHEGLVHHMIVYACYDDLDEHYESKGLDCTDRPMNPLMKCDAAIMGWGVGANAHNFPLNVGKRIGKGLYPKIVRMETHFNNPPPSRSGLTDSSGFRIYYTNKLRKYDTGVLTMGAPPSDWMVIPPKFERLTTHFHCSSKCLSAGIGEGEDMKFFSAFLHSHSLGTRIVVRHFRDGVELPPIVRDDYYDPNYQDPFIFPEEVVVKPTDNIIVECDYSSKDRHHPTYGGFNLKDEMCLVWLMYYPKYNFSRCMMLPSPYQTLRFINPEIQPDTKHPAFFHDHFRFNITSSNKTYSSKHMQQIIGDSQVDWSRSETREKYQQMLLRTDIPALQVCSDGVGRPLVGPNDTFPFKRMDIEDEYVYKNTQIEETCRESSSSKIVSSGLLCIWSGLIPIVLQRIIL